MRRSELVFFAALIFIASGARAQAPAPTGPSAAVVVKPSAPTCLDVASSVDAIESVGREIVPLTADPETNYRVMEGAQEINKKYNAEKVEKLVFDNTLDLPSQARLLSEFRCWGKWKKQHDFYRRVVKEHRCALLRHRAVQLLEFDMCNHETIGVLVAEYGRSLYQQTKELILRKMGMSSDRRAKILIEEALRSSSKILNKAAKEGKASGNTQPCMPQDPAGKPYYGYMDISDICEGVPLEGDSGLVKKSAGSEDTAPPEKEKEKSDKDAEPARKAGGASNVEFKN